MTDTNMSLSLSAKVGNITVTLGMDDKVSLNRELGQLGGRDYISLSASEWASIAETVNMFRRAQAAAKREYE